MSRLKKLLSIVLTISLLCTTLLSTGMIVHASMLPLEEVNAYLILNGKTNDEIKSFDLDEMLNMLVDADGKSISISNSATTVWKYNKSATDGLEEYKKYSIGKNETIDLSIESGIKAYTIELIIGSDYQLDSSNIRYIVKVYVTNTIQEEIGYELYLQDATGNRNKAIPERKNSAVNVQLFEFTANEWVVPEPQNGSQYYLNLSSLADEHPNVRTEVYDFWDYILFSNSATPITTTILKQDMNKIGSGLPINYGSANAKMLALVYFDNNGQIIGQSFISFAAVNDTSYIQANLYHKENNEYTDIVLFDADHIGFDNIDSIFSGAGVHELCLMLKEGYSVDSDIYCVLNAHGSTYGDLANNYVLKAVEGYYDSLDDAVNCKDIKEQLIPADKLSTTRGYKTDYNYKNGGAPFTVFFEDGNVWKVLVVAMEYDPKYDEGYVRTFTEKPIIGEADPWIRVVGASNANGKAYDTYVIENGKSINMDTYYGYGYQTVLIKDANADLSNIKPEFWYANTERVYAVDENTGLRIDSNHIRDFSKENQQYAGIIIDKSNKENERNYWVTYKKLNNTGPELFVYGPNEREVILDEYFEFKHDILIANIGNKPLEDISVKLLDAENVKLDPYWTVGGDGNDTLAAFTTTSTNTKYGTLANLAKIRLLPDGDGEVKGTLVISAKGQSPVMITLNGTAQNPEIITNKLDDAVKYVPYQHIIATNNMHHDWVETKFSVIEGQLPAGITLNEDTGEIYGVPTVPTGSTEQTYTFTVKATFLVDGVEGYFESATKQFSIKVKPNTDENVYLASDRDEGYQILDHIGVEDGQYHYVLEVFTDTVFRSNGEFGEFEALWLNGEKLDVDVDYDAEPGSTKITVKGQTFENKTNTNETNTIAMEFRNDDNELNRTSQNFVPKTYPNVDKVIAKINALPSATNITLSNKSAVQSARTDYNALSSTEKAKITNYSKLVDCENKIAQLEADQAAANAVIAKINAIPSTINSNARDEISAARTAYDSLNSAQKALVTNLKRLTDAEAALKLYDTQQADKAAAESVEALIRAIPSTIDSNAKDEIQAARNAYNNLTSTQKGYVSNYSRLTSAESALKTYEEQQAKIAADKAEANKVVAKINAIPANLTLNDKGTVNVARSAYNSLTASQKGYVSNFDKLTSAEERIIVLEAEAQEQAAINAVIAAINDIPDNLTLSGKAKVTAARNAYNALTSSQKKKVVNYNDLTSAEDTIAALEAQESANKADKAAADAVIAKINALPSEIKLADKTNVQNARNAYNVLSQKQKSLVTNYSTLTDAEATIKALEDYEEANKKDQNAAKAVIDLINALPKSIALSDKEAVAIARSAYDGLTEKQKQIVTNYNDLTAAEVKIAELEDDNYEEIKTVTFVGILVDKNGKPYADKVIEIHSTVQNGRSDENGSFQFNDVEFGEHTILVKNDAGSILAQKKFSIKLGSPLSITDSEIVASNGTVFTLKMEMDDNNIKFLTIEEGNKTPVLDTDKDDEGEGGINIGEDKTPEKDDDEDDGINIGDADKDNGNKDSGSKPNPDQDVQSPQTGDDSNLILWYTLLFVSLGGLIVTTYSGMRKRKYVGKYQR